MFRLPLLIGLIIVLILFIVIQSRIPNQGTLNSREQRNLEPTSTPAKNPTPTRTSIPSPVADSNAPISLDSFVYPSSNLLNRTESRLILESSDDPKTIAGWYRSIIEKEFNARSFVQTEVNDNILYRLVGREGDTQYSIEIRKERNESSSTITVTKR